MEGPSSGHGTSAWHYEPPELGVRALLGDQALSFPGTEFAVRPEVRQLSKFRSSRKGRIRVNSEVLAVLKQVSAELDAAQRHYLAYKQFGPAGESILKLSPELFFLPPDGAPGAAAASDAGTAAADEQDGAAAAAADPSGTASATGAEPAEDLLVGHRRWGYFPMLAKLRAGSAKPRKAPAKQQQLNVSAAGAAPPADAAAAAAAAGVQDDWDGQPDSPKSNWMEVMKQKKQAKEEGIARMIRVKHAVLVIQRAWRKHIQKRASRALAMMMLRAKVRRAHRAAYVSNLLRRKTPGVGGSTDRGSGEGDSSLVDGAAEDDDDDAVELTVQQERQLQQALQHVLDEGQLSMADIAELQLTHLVHKVTADKDGDGSGGLQESESESDEEAAAEEQPAGGWKVLSKPTMPVKRPPALRVDTEAPAGSAWQGSLRTPGTTRTSTRLGTPRDSDSPSGSRTHRGMSRRSAASNAGPAQPKTGSKDDTSGSSSSRHGGDPVHIAGAANSEDSDSAGSSQCGSGSSSPRTQGCFGGGGDGCSSPKRASVSRGALKSAGGVRVGKSVSVVLAKADNAVAIAHGSGGVSVRARSAARQPHRSISRFNPAAAAAAVAATDDDDAPVKAAFADTASTDTSLPGTASSTRRPSRQGVWDDVAASAEELSNGGSHRPSKVSAAVRFADGAASLSAGAEAGGHTASAADGGAASLGQSSTSAEAGWVLAAADAGLGPTSSQQEEVQAKQQLHQQLEQYWQQQQQQWQQLHPHEALPAALAAAPAAAASLQVGSSESQQAVQQMQHMQVQDMVAGDGADDLQQQQQQEQGQAQGQEGADGMTSAASGTTSDPATMAAAMLAAAAAAAEGRSPRPNSCTADYRTPSRTNHNGSTHSSQTGAVSDCDIATLNACPHYATPLPPNKGLHDTAGISRSSSSSSPSDGDTRASHCGSTSASGAHCTASSRRSTPEGGPSSGSSRGFCAESLSGTASSKHAWGAADGLQAHNVAAAEALLAGRRAASLPMPARRQKQQPDGGAGSNSMQEQQQQQQQVRVAGDPNFCAEPSIAQPQLQSKQASGSASSSSSISYTSRTADSSSLQDHAAADAALAAGLQQYRAAAAAAAAAAASGLPGAMAGLVLSPAGFWQQLEQQQQQQQLRADGWYNRLMKHQKISNRQPWDASAAGGKQQGGVTEAGSDDVAAQQRAPEMPSGVWGRRGKVHDAWLFIDGRTAAALPWQALAAAAAAGAAAGGDTEVQVAALGAAAAFMEPPACGGSSMSHMSVQGKKLLLRVMWMKSATGVLRRLGKDPKVLENRVLQLLKQQTGPAGAQLLLWSVDDQQQQQELLQQQQQQKLLQQLQLMLLQQQQRQSAIDLGAGGWGGQLGLGLQQNPVLAQSGVGLNPRVSGLSYPGFAACGDMLGQHLPRLPAARSRALSTQLMPGALQQQHQQELLLQQQQQQLLAMVAQQQQQQHQASCQLPLGADQRPFVGARPVDMQQLLAIQQHLLQQSIFQQHQEQQQYGQGEASGAVPVAQNELPMCRKMVLARRTRGTVEEPMRPEAAGGVRVPEGAAPAAAAASAMASVALPLTGHAEDTVRATVPRMPPQAMLHNVGLTQPGEPSCQIPVAAVGLGSSTASGGLQVQTLMRHTQGQQLQQQRQLALPQQTQLQQHVQHSSMAQPAGKAGSSQQQLQAQLPAAATHLAAPTNSQQHRSPLPPPARCASPTGAPVSVAFVASSSRYQQQAKMTKAQQRRRSHGGLQASAAGSAAAAGVEVMHLERASLALKIGGSSADTSWRQQQQQSVGNSAPEVVPSLLRTLLSQQQPQQQQSRHRQQTKSAGHTQEQQQQQQRWPAPPAGARSRGAGVFLDSAALVAAAAGGNQVQTNSSRAVDGSFLAGHSNKATRILQLKRHASSSGIAAATSTRIMAAGARPGGVSVSQPRLPQLAALRVAADAGGKGAAMTAAGGAAGAAAGLLPAIVLRSM